MSEGVTMVVVDGYDVECHYDIIPCTWPYFEVDIFLLDGKQPEEFDQDTLRNVEGQIKDGIVDVDHED